MMYYLKEDYSTTPIYDNCHMVYIIRHIPSKSYYIGVHSAIKNDILIEYFTSSTLIQKVISIEGITAFNVEYVIFVRNRDIAENIESMLIKLNWKDPFQLNRSYKEKNKLHKKNLVCKYLNIPMHKCKLTSPIRPGRNKSLTMKFGYLFDPNYTEYGPKINSKVWNNVVNTLL